MLVVLLLLGGHKRTSRVGIFHRGNSQIICGIDCNTVHACFKEQTVARCEARSSHMTYNIALRNSLTLVYGNIGAVCIKGRKSVTVVNNSIVSVIFIKTADNYCA